MAAPSDETFSEQQVANRTFDPLTNAQDVTVIPSSSSTSVQRITGGGPAPGQTIKSVAGNLVTTSVSATQTINTVTALKTFYITDIDLSGVVAAALDVQIQIAGVVVFERHVSISNSCDFAGIDSFPPASAGQVVRIFVSNSVAASSLNFFVSGYEQ